MIYYKNGRWGVSVLFSLEGSVFPKAAAISLPCATFAFLLSYFGEHHVDRETTGAGVLWAGYNMLLGFLIVFRTNPAYSRFWEGTSLLHQIRGEWFNATSSVFAFCSNRPERVQQVHNFQQIMVKLMSLLFCSAAHQVSTFEQLVDFEVLDIYGIDPKSLSHLRASPDRCETVLQWIQRLIIEGHLEGTVDVPPPILTRAFQELSRGIVNLKQVTMIKEVPFPFPYAQMLAAMMVLHSVSTPWMASQTVESPIVGGVLSFCVTCGFWSLHYIAQEIDQPFGEDANDINLAGMLGEFNESLIFLTEAQTRTVPHFVVSGRVTNASRRHLGSVTTAVLADIDTTQSSPSAFSELHEAAETVRRGSVRSSPPGRPSGWAAWCGWIARRRASRARGRMMHADHGAAATEAGRDDDPTKGHAPGPPDPHDGVSAIGGPEIDRAMGGTSSYAHPLDIVITQQEDLAVARRFVSCDDGDEEPSQPQPSPAAYGARAP
eukprot:CAMPEP_0198498548 /NCGR_PEP_ID=MMETSP1462-20131121/7077_1 /TAXON_ID=1333877 /ORGANISM="Brandtodinium nutriculum, Strain RCC3387" /LENGTH=489 /DNA_ID=CAMNT_0044227471 /DNA_START=73 /DNA_END=1542 /DNA_ORIENTATION=-